jgi:hypothetical protein
VTRSPADLVDLVDALRSRDDRPTRRPTSRIARDRQMAAFVDSALERMLTYAAIHAECVERFGRARTPSPSAIARYAARQLASGGGSNR